ncbi:MAG: pimeloyl-ACP methyl ester esterase BioH, partial [Gammaproteobacteria bacterium]
GWGLHGGIWDDLVPRLAERYRVSRVDLPGHGHSRDEPPSAELTELAARVADAVPGPATWLGWSLGGMVAMRVALDRPEAVRSLALVATTPRFVTGPDWRCAAAPHTLTRFADSLHRDYRQTVEYFLTLQVHGDDQARPLLRDLRRRVFAHGDPDPAGLQAGLDILRDADLRHEVAAIRAPTRVIMGQRDRLTPPAAGEWLAAAIPSAECITIPRAAHTPFVSHIAEFRTALEGLPADPGVGASA